MSLTRSAAGDMCFACDGYHRYGDVRQANSRFSPEPLMWLHEELPGEKFSTRREAHRAACLARQEANATEGVKR